jgi:hypothetical protein
MRETLLTIAVLAVVALVAACAPRVRTDPAADLRAYDACAAVAAPWGKVRDEVIAFSREGVALATAVDALFVTARTAAGEHVLIPSDEVADALSRHSWQTRSINPLRDWEQRDEREPLLALSRCLSERYGYRFAVVPTTSR